jgi:hypothetical protein
LIKTITKVGNSQGIIFDAAVKELEKLPARLDRAFKGEL